MDPTTTGAPNLLTDNQIPAALGRTSSKGLQTWLYNRHVIRTERSSTASSSPLPAKEKVQIFNQLRT
ncbi:hypothetical protein ACFV2N_47030 [Streptomyces sp. NPDC059680]|uniref:hypothetical protein n=1 Tax=Streptomyces sp. NPDC059680 TaxID=3346904 RepID=UPI003697D91C